MANLNGFRLVMELFLHEEKLIEDAQDHSFLQRPKSPLRAVRTINHMMPHLEPLDKRTLAYASNIRGFIRTFPRNALLIDDIRQLLRSSGSVGANYIEANESLGTKDCTMHLKICRKEAKESLFWLKLLQPFVSAAYAKICLNLLQESQELVLIFTAIVRKRSTKAMPLGI